MHETKAFMKELLVVYHSRTGGTAQMAQAAADGAATAGSIAVQSRTAPQTEPEHLLAADAYIFACPENVAAIAGLMKEFFDRCYYPVLERLNARPYLALICAGSDGSNAARQPERIAIGWRLKQIAPTHIVCTHPQTSEEILRPKHINSADLARCRELGATLG